MLLSDTLNNCTMQHRLQGEEVPRGLESRDVDHTHYFHQRRWKPTSMFLCQNFKILPSFSCLSQRHHEFRLFSRFHWLAQTNTAVTVSSTGLKVKCLSLIWSAVDLLIPKSANPLAPPHTQQNNNHLFHCWPFILSSHHLEFPLFAPVSQPDPSSPCCLSAHTL